MAAKLLKNDRDFVVPGEPLVRSMEYLPGKNCFREGEDIKARKLGIVRVDGRVLSVIALNGVYIPVRGDMIIGEIDDIQSNGWIVRINSISSSYLPLSGVPGFIDTNRTDLSKVYGVGDAIYAKVDSVSSDLSSVHLYMKDRVCRKFSGGRIISMNPAKVPRLIGKRGSMIELIKNRTGCRVVVGQNGLVWMGEENQEKVLQVIDLIQRESHLEGLTNKVEKMLGGPRPAPSEERPAERESRPEQAPEEKGDDNEA